MFLKKRSFSGAKLIKFQNYRIKRAKYLKMEKFCHINSIVSNSSINSNKGFLNDTVPRNYNRVIDLMIIIIDKGGEMDTMRVRIQILWYENIKLRDKLVASSKIYPPEEVK